MEQKIEFEIEYCRICKCALIYDVVNIRQKGLKTLISVSAIRKDGLFSDEDEAATNLRLHTKCRAIYANEKMVAAALKKQDVNCESVFIETRDASPMQDLHLIDYESQCLFCAEDASEHFITNQRKRTTNRRVVVHKVSKAETREKILQASFVNDDQWSYQVRERIQGVDLVSLNARYHQNCFSKFFLPKRSVGNKRGRPEWAQTSEQMEQVYKFVESYGSQFSIQDIKQAFPDLPTEKTIRRKLIEHYGDKLAVMDSKGKPSIYCFVSTSLKLIHDQYMERLERQTNSETLDLSVSGLSDRASVVRAAANIILEDIESRANDTKFNPASTDFWQDIKSVVPNTLDIFLKILITDNTKDANDYDRKVTALAHTIVSAARPRSFRSPLLLGISSMIHQKYSSKTLIDLLSTLGFCESYSEVNKFGNSNISHSPCQQQAEADCESHNEVNKFGNLKISHSPCQQQTEAENSTQYFSDNADVRLTTEEVPKEMLELISCKCKKSSRRSCSDDNCCNKKNTVPFDEEEVLVKEEKLENGTDPLESVEKTPAENDVKAINKYEYDDDGDMENVGMVNLSKKRRI